MDLEFIRGDTQFIKFPLTSEDGNPIELNNNEKLYFTVKQNANSKKVLIQKKYPTDMEYSEGYYYFTLTSQDTSNLNYGTYEFDIELKSDNYVRTLAMGTLTLTEEITHRRDE